MFDLNFSWVTIDCPNCRYQEEIQLVDAKSEKIIFCHNCKSSIQLRDESASVHSGVESINKAMKDLQHLFKNFGK